MANSHSTHHGSPSPRRLAELLNEQQEPFVLEVYLLERGYKFRRSLELEGKSISCCSSNTNINRNNSSKFLKKSFSYHFGSKPISKIYSSSQFSNLARNLFNKFVSKKWKKKKKIDSFESTIGRCSSSISCSSDMSISTWSNSEIDGEINSLSSPANNEITANYDQSFSDRLMNHNKNQWRIVEENKQCSPVSVLEEIDLLQPIPVYNVLGLKLDAVRQTCEETTSQSRIRFQKKVSEDSILSASLWEQLIQLKKEKFKQKQKHKRKPFPDYMNTKRVLHQSRQLLFDCVRETIENRKRNNNNNNNNNNDNDNDKGLKMGPEEIGKIICRNLKKWGKHSIDKTNIDQVMRMDLLEGYGDEWGCFDVCNKEIVREIGNGIVDEIIEEIIKDLNHISIINDGSTSGE